MIKQAIEDATVAKDILQQQKTNKLASNSNPPPQSQSRKSHPSESRCAKSSCVTLLLLTLLAVEILIIFIIMHSRANPVRFNFQATS